MCRCPTTSTGRAEHPRSAPGVGVEPYASKALIRAMHETLPLDRRAPGEALLDVVENSRRTTPATCSSMSDQLGTIEQLLRHLAEALEPLADELHRRCCRTSASDTGRVERAGRGRLCACIVRRRGFARSDAGSDHRGDGWQRRDIIAKSAALGVRIAQVAATASQLADTIKQAANADGVLTPARRRTSTIASTISWRGWQAARSAHARAEAPAAGGDPRSARDVHEHCAARGVGRPTAPPHIRRGFGFDRVVTLFEDPQQYARDLYGWGDPASTAGRRGERWQIRPDVSAATR